VITLPDGTWQRRRQGTRGSSAVLAAPAHSPAIVSVPPGRYRGGGVLAGMAPGSLRPAAGAAGRL
jgi:hypothetical protein